MHDEFYGQKERKTHHDDEPHCCLLFAKSSKTIGLLALLVWLLKRWNHQVERIG